MNVLSRKNEYQADKFAADNYDAEALASSLKKLSVKNLSNLTPHPRYVFFHYSHPTLLQRLSYLKSLERNMKAEIITIGDEILIGQIVDTNSAMDCKKN